MVMVDSTINYLIQLLKKDGLIFQKILLQKICQKI